MIRAPLVSRLAAQVDVMPICPEVEIGLGVPRDPIRLVRGASGPALLQPATGRDLTAAMDSFASRFLAALPEVEGFLLKARSPSCGIHGVKVFPDNVAQAPVGRGTGRFAAAVLDAFPDHPVEHEGRLANPRLLDWFLTRLFALADLRSARDRDASVAGLATLHERHRLMLIAWVPERRDALDRIVADARSGSRGPRDAWDGYSRGFRRALARPVGIRAHLRVIEDVVESLDDLLPAAGRERLGELAEGYRTGHIPRRVLPAAVREQAERSAPRLVSQAYLDAYPPELAQLDGGRLTL